MWTMFFLTLAAFGIAMAIMAVGVMFKRPCLRGSCGGPEVLASNGEPLSCATCPNRKKNRRAQAGGRGGLPVLGQS